MFRRSMHTIRRSAASQLFSSSFPSSRPFSSVYSSSIVRPSFSHTRFPCSSSLHRFFSNDRSLSSVSPIPSAPSISSPSPSPSSSPSSSPSFPSSSLHIHRPSSSSPPLSSSFHLDHSFSSNPFFDRHTKTPSIWPLIYAGAAIGALILYIVAHLETIPFSSRFHLIFLSHAAERSFGEEFFEKEIARKKIVDNDEEVTEFIKEIAAKLCFVAENMWREGGKEDNNNRKTNKESPFEWRIVIVDSPSINAVCYPGGKLVVYRGLIDFMKQAIHNELKQEQEQKGISEKDHNNNNNHNNNNSVMNSLSVLNNNHSNSDEVSTALQSIRFHIEGWFANAQMLFNAVVYNNPHASSTEQIAMGGGGTEESSEDNERSSHTSSSSHFYESESSKIVLPPRSSAAYHRLENELAFILAHEIGHTLARHVAEKISFFSPFSMIAGLLFPSSPLLNYLFQYFIELPYSRSHETEADKIGLILVARSDYDPHAALRVLRRRQENSTPSVLHYVSTHPADERRAKKCEGWMAMAEQEKNAYANEMNARFQSFREYLQQIQKGKESKEGEKMKKKRF